MIAERHDDLGQHKYFTRVGRELLTCNNNGSLYYYIQNYRGDVVMLVNPDGTVHSLRDYDVNGRLIEKQIGTNTDVDRDPFGFIGGLDAGDGFWKLGARFYDSSKGSFIQQDRYLGDPSDPLSLNRYVYCGLDPVNFVDPTGFDDYNINEFYSYEQTLANNYINDTWNTIANGFSEFGEAVYLSAEFKLKIGTLLDVHAQLSTKAETGSISAGTGVTLGQDTVKVDYSANRYGSKVTTLESANGKIGKIDASCKSDSTLSIKTPTKPSIGFNININQLITWWNKWFNNN